MTTGRQSVLPAGGRASFRSKGLVLFGTLLILSSMFAYVAARPQSALAAEGVRLSISTPPNQTADDEFTVTVDVLDGDDAVDETSDATVTLALSGGSLGSVLEGVVQVDASAGVATFEDLAVRKAGTGYKLTATADGLTSAESGTFDVSHGALTGLVIDPDSSTITADDSETYTAEGTDAFGNTFDAAGATTLDIDPDGTVSQPAGCSVLSCFARGVGDYTVTGSAATSSDTSSLSVTPGELDHFSIATVGSKVAGTPFNVTITAWDAWSNIKTDYTGTPTLTGLAASLGCGTCAPSFGSVPASHGPISFTNGVAIVSVTAVKAVAVAGPGTGAQFTVADGSSNGVSNYFTVTNSLVEGGVTIDSITGQQTAGTPFGVTVRAFDEFGNVRTGASGGSLTGLAGSLGCAGCSPVINSVPASHTAISWLSGVGTTNVTAVRSTNGATAQFTATIGTKSNTSSLIDVTAATLNKLVFSNSTVGFNGQPVDTKTAQPIYSVCNPYIPAQPAAVNPCDPGTSVATKVLAVDAYGNRKGGVSVSVSSTPSGVTGGGAASTTNTGDPTAAGFGEVSFTNLRLSSLGSDTKLTATSGAVSRQSVQFRIVNDLTSCQGSTCVNKNGNSARAAYGKITATNGLFFDTGRNVNLTTAFVSNDQTKNQCKSSTKPSVSNSKPIGPDATELRVIGLGVTESGPTTRMLIVIPKDVMKAAGVTARSASAFEVCLGTIWIGAGTASAWTGKNPATNGTQPAVAATDPANLGGLVRYWGVPRDCTAAIQANNPCISLKTKQKADILARLGPEAAALMNDADIGIIIEKPIMWDGKGGVF